MNTSQKKPSQLMTLQARPHVDPALMTFAILACCVPTLLAYNKPPSPIALNECFGVVFWGGVAAMVATPVDARREYWKQIAPLMAALTLVLIAALGSWAWGNLPLSMSFPAVGMLAGALLMVASGASATRGPNGAGAFSALAVGLLVAGLAGSVVALLQVYAHGWADPNWIAPTNAIGRAPGNIRQPNQLASLLLWALVAAVALFELRRIPKAVLWLAGFFLVWALELTASRMGAVGLVVLIVWAFLDRHLARASRQFLAALPLMYALFYWTLALLTRIGQQQQGDRARGVAALGVGDVDSRLFIWRNAIDLISNQPLTGVGFGDFRLAWILSPLGYRSGQYFDNAHNFFLQLAVELGLPLASIVIGLLVIALLQALRRSRKVIGDAGTVARSCLVLMLTIGLHSMVEYPLWYAFFLFPASLAFGFALGATSSHLDELNPGDSTQDKPISQKFSWGFIAGLIMSLTGVWALLDYQKTILTFTQPHPGPELIARLKEIQNSYFFAHFADYAITNMNPAIIKVSDDILETANAGAIHKGISTGIMIPWSYRLAARGELEKARWLAQRIREFPSPEVEAYLAPCKDVTNDSFQCQWPATTHSWREFAIQTPKKISKN